VAHIQGVFGRRADDDGRRVVDVAEFPVPALAADKIDEPDIVIVQVCKNMRRRMAGIRRREIDPHQGIREVLALPDGRIDRPVGRIPVPKKLPGVPEDLDALGHGPPRIRTQVRRRHRPKVRSRTALERHLGDVVGPELALPAGENEGRGDDQPLAFAARRRDGRRGRGPGVFATVHIDVFNLELADRRRIDRCSRDGDSGGIDISSSSAKRRARHFSRAPKCLNSCQGRLL
jgi:hypothetical protein